MEGHGATPKKSTGGIVKGTVGVTDTTLTQAIAAPGSGLALMITCIVIDNSHATSKTGVNLYSGSTKIFGPIPAPAAGGAIMVPLDPPLPCAENQPLKMQTVDSVPTISLSVLGYIAAAGNT